MHTELTDAWLHLENASVSLTAALDEASAVEALIIVRANRPAEGGQVQRPVRAPEEQEQMMQDDRQGLTMRFQQRRMPAGRWTAIRRTAALPRGS